MLATTQVIRIDLVQEPHAKDFVESEEVANLAVDEVFDPAYATRAIVDIVPNPWLARALVGQVLQDLQINGFTPRQIADIASRIIESLRLCLLQERDRLAEAIFLQDVADGRIQFRLRTDRLNWRLPDEYLTNRPLNSPLLQRDDGKIAESCLFDPVYKDDLDGYEQKVACYLDSEKALRWWHRNVAKAQDGYALQGWRKHKVYPDFIFALTQQSGSQRLWVLETKGDHLDNPDTAYKKKLFEICSAAFKLQDVKPAGEVELLADDGVHVRCALIFESNWQTDLAKLIEDTAS